MASIIPGYNYDIFISYRQKDNKGDRWVSEFVEALKTELESTFKEEISLYFDINPHDGLLETHDVDASLKEKLKCLIFIPILSRTYCDPRSFAWEHEFKAFVEMASEDQYGLKVKLPNGNVASRVLPVQIHQLEQEDIRLCESLMGTKLRGIEFIYSEPGVNKPLTPGLNSNKYSIQINKVANAIKEIITGHLQQVALPEAKFKSQEQRSSTDYDQISIRKSVPVKLKRLLPFAIVFVLLLISALVLFYPRLTRLRNITVPFTVLNEFGQKETHTAFREEYLTRLSVFPFINESNDSSVNWLEYGIYFGVRQDLQQFNYVSVSGNPVDSLLKSRINAAARFNAPYFVTGSFRITDDVYQITSRIYRTSDGAVLTVRKFIGKDFFGLIDSISLRVRKDLGIRSDILNSSPDLPAREHITDNLSAFRYFIKGYFPSHSSGISIKNLGMAIRIDSTFAWASFMKARYCYLSQASQITAIRSIDQAMRHRNRMVEYNEIDIRLFSHLIHGEKDEAVALAQLQNKLKPDDYDLLWELIKVYEMSSMYEEAANACELADKFLPGNVEIKLLMADAYQRSNQFDKSLKVSEKIIEETPGDPRAMALVAETNLLMNNLEVAEDIFNKLMLLNPEEKSMLAKLINHIAYIKNNRVDNGYLEKFTGKYKGEGSEMNYILSVINGHLILKSENQQGSLFLYPYSDNQFIATSVFGSPLYFALINFYSETQQKATKFTFEVGGRTWEYWKEDTLITKAKDLMNNGASAESLNLFRKAFELYPDHYYLKKYISHLEFIQSPEYEKQKTALFNTQGSYGNLVIFSENGQFYYKNQYDLIYRLLPLSEEQFMAPSYYNIIIRITKDKAGITGLKFIHRNGKEEFFSRSK